MFKVNQFEPKTLRWWWTQRKQIDMSPDYQRSGRLWSRSDKAFLVDSILNEYDVPKIYIADFTYGSTLLNKQKLPYAIIDGKQRMEAIIDFFDGELVLDSAFVFEQDRNLVLGGLGYGDLRKNYPEVADIFDNFSLSVMRVVTDDEKKINELFVRLNRSKALTGAEIRNAMAGQVPQLTRLVTKHVFFDACIKFTRTRGQDKNAATKLLLFEYHQKLSETKKKNLDAFVIEAEKAAPDSLELASRRVNDTLDRMAEIFLPGDPLLTSAGTLPVYYWFISKRSPQVDSLIREFLVFFENERKRNRGISKGGIAPSESAGSLLQFDILSRSTNDQRSYEVRFEILNDWFDKNFRTNIPKRSR